MFLTRIFLTELNNSRIDYYFEKLVDWLIDKAFFIFIAIIFLYIGTRLVKLLLKIIKRSFDKTNMEGSVSGFLLSLIKGILYIVLFITAATIVGFQVTSFVTILGTTGLTIGLALQGSLANFAGGVLILLMKPFKVGDYIIENDKKCEGTVVAIDIFYTKLKTYDNKLVVIPNGNITANSLVNLTAEKNRLLDIVVGVAYSSDIKLVKSILEKIAKESSYINDKNNVTVYVEALAESAINVGVRCYVNTENYWPAKWEMTENIKAAFDANGIVIPFKQLDVTVSNN